MTLVSGDPQFRNEDTVFQSTAGMPGRFASNFDFQLAGVLGDLVVVDGHGTDGGEEGQGTLPWWQAHRH